MKALIVAALILACAPASALAAAPTFGTKEGDIACAGLLKFGFRGALAAKPQVAQAVMVTGLAYGFFVGRLSKTAPDMTPAQVDQGFAKLTPEERNAYGNLCLKRAGDLMQPHLR